MNKEKRNWIGRLLMASIGAIFLAGAFAAAAAAGIDELKIPPEKQAQWQHMKDRLMGVNAVCEEHCGGDSGCLEKCRSMLESRMENAFQMLTRGDRPPETDISAAPNCPYCGMDRQKFDHSRVFVEYDDGSTLGACSLHCAAIDMAVNIDKGPLHIWVGDYKTKELVDAEKAAWTIGGDQMGVMTHRAKWAFADTADAEKYVKEHGGKSAGFEEAMEAAYEDMYKDTRMIREKRQKMRMKRK